MKTTYRLSAISLKARQDILRSMRKERVQYTVKWKDGEYLLICFTNELYCK
jgi:hypothetical protein